MGLPLYTAALQGAMGSGSPSLHHRTAGGKVQGASFSTVPHCKEQWEEGLLQYTVVVQGVISSRYLGTDGVVASPHGLLGLVSGPARHV